MQRTGWCVSLLALVCWLVCGPVDCLAETQAKRPAGWKAPPGLSNVQTVALASEIVGYVTGNPHTSKDWQWVTVALPERRLPKLSAIVRDELAKRYRVVDKEPEGSRSPARPHELVNGALLSIDVRQNRKDRLRVSYRDYEGPLAGSAQTVEYEWADGRWRAVSKSNMVIY